MSKKIITVFILLFAIGFTVGFLVTSKPVTEFRSKAVSDVSCPAIYQPVCGMLPNCSRKTYGNSCYMGISGDGAVFLFNGACDGPESALIGITATENTCRGNRSCFSGGVRTSDSTKCCSGKAKDLGIRCVTTPCNSLECLPSEVSCNQTCASAGYICTSGLTCYQTSSLMGSDKCRNPNCLFSETCNCPTPTPTPKVATCNQTCVSAGYTCDAGLSCYQTSSLLGSDKCRNPNCLLNENCQCVNTNKASCDASCGNDTDCWEGYRCLTVTGVKRCRLAECPDAVSCICPTPTPTTESGTGGWYYPTITPRPRNTSKPTPTMILATPMMVDFESTLSGTPTPTAYMFPTLSPTPFAAMPTTGGNGSLWDWIIGIGVAGVLFFIGKKVFGKRKITPIPPIAVHEETENEKKETNPETQQPLI